MLTSKEINERLQRDFYKSKISTVGASPAQHKEACKDQARLDDLFETEALAALGLIGHPKEKAVWNLAYEYGHACGMSEVWHYLQDLADLVK